ncbi:MULTISPECIES: DUF4083 family protein [Paenibacillus]|uniref:DUF4083 family protein n=1 Tax=Paenibacillus TaxID=44249 RepID=UPI00020D71FA|nr:MULTISPECIES: DUF4083 family protein [Paenibacillus]EGL18826.1 hypothetical protein HMPREF9413_2462 [Paenibacillus sp. HGF7]EPD92739.1 hypothetical protein HMPREF1207_00510 [Paenibacillus sp. HGH0039]MBV6713143.1 DUF4083 family protein [Paenibacillus chitinolyticus]
MMDTIGFVSWASIVYLLVIFGFIAIFITSLSMFIRTRVNRRLFTLTKLQRIEEKLDRLLDMQPQNVQKNQDRERLVNEPEDERRY